MHSSTHAIVSRLALPIILILLWWVVAAAAGSVYLPTLDRIWEEFWVWMPEGLTEDILPSLRNLLLGFLLASVVGVLLGTVLGRVRTAEYAVAPLLHLLRSIPPAALLPLFIIALGPTAQMRVSIIAFGAVWPTLLATIDGVRGIDPVTMDVTRVYRTSPLRRFFLVILPAASPLILSGMRTTLAFSVILVVVSEMMASTEGIGYFIVASQGYFNLPGLWAGTVVMGIIGYLVSEIFFFGERRALRWKGESDAHL